jgi:3-oxo-5-alpha-steroid 4-dehydrogenase 1
MSETYYNYILNSWTLLAILVFFLLFFVKAPFGRHNSTKWGPMINARLAWVIMELASPLFFAYFFLANNKQSNWMTLLFFSLWMVHYFNRSVIYPLRQRDHQKKMPVLIMLFALFFNFMNGFLNGYFLGNNAELYSNNWHLQINFWVGLMVFFAGMIINIQSDNILLNLRKPGESGYKIPQGGLFPYISCPNLFGEILEWLGFAILTLSMPAFSFALWTFANLGPRAVAHHRWYLQKFEHYPKKRKALIPFIY